MNHITRVLQFTFTTELHIQDLLDLYIPDSLFQTKQIFGRMLLTVVTMMEQQDCTHWICDHDDDDDTEEEAKSLMVIIMTK